MCERCTGEPELCYWQKAATDRQRKHNSKNSRTAKRGRDKVKVKVEVKLAYILVRSKAYLKP